MTHQDKYITFIKASKNEMTLTFYISTSLPMKYIVMTTSGQHYSIPIAASHTDMLSEYDVQVRFEFESLDAFQEYVDLGVIYDINININWF